MRFGKYELLSRLRVGGMAEVFLARPTAQPDRVVAIKRILPSFTDEADYVAMFRDEASLALRLRHPAIAEAFEVGQVEDAYYIALEYVHGQDASVLLRRAREQHDPLPVAVACMIAIETARALHYAHRLSDASGASLGIVHRDVSPQNVLVSYSGDVKLIDFGIAKSSEQLMRTQAGLMKGKHGYLSPEQAQGKPVDHRSDIFSLGICLYEMLSAQRLFQGSSDFSTIVKVRKADVPDLSAQNAAVPDELAAIVQRALARDRSDRFQSAAEMADALTRFVEGSGERCDRERLAQFMRVKFAEELKGDAFEAPEGDHDSGTGLLDAFDDIEPVSTISQLVQLSDFQEVEAASAVVGTDAMHQVGVAATPEPVQLEATDDVDAGFEEYDEVDEDAEEVEGAGESRVIAGIDHTQELHAEDTELSPHSDAPVNLAAVAEANHEPVTGRPAANDDATRVVAYQSTIDGQLDEQAQEHEIDTNPPVARQIEEHPELQSARAATLPGLGMDWDDEDMSTQLYDAPEHEGGVHDVADTLRAKAAAGKQSSADAVARAPGSGPSLSPPRGVQPGLSPSALSVAPRRSLSSTPGAPSPFATGRTNGQVGLPASPYAATPSIVPAPRPSQAPAPAAVVANRYPLGVVAIAVAIILGLLVGGVLYFRDPAPGTLHITTLPIDAVVTVDGAPSGGSASPFILSNLSAGAMHLVEISKPGYHRWATQLSLRPGESMQLPPVELAPEVSPVATPPQQAVVPVVAAVPAPVPKPVVAPTTTTKVHSTSSSTTARHSPARVAPSSGGTGTGTLRINSRPWSVVYVDGRVIGNTPQMSIILGTGKHVVTLANTEFALKKTITIEIAAGQVVTQIVELTQ